MRNETVIYIVDDDSAVRDAISKLVNSVGMSAQCFSSAEEFLEGYSEDAPGCLVLDVRMNGMGGLELQQELLNKGSMIPIVIITGHGDIPMAVDALKNGAVNFIEKPFRNQSLLDAIRAAIQKDKKIRILDESNRNLVEKYSTLTEREREISKFITQGLSSKLIAKELNLSPRTVESHRANIMKKMESNNSLELFRQLMLIGNIKREVATTSSV